MKEKGRIMNGSEKEYRVNEQGMIVEEIDDLEIEEIIRSVQDMDHALENFAFEKTTTSTFQAPHLHLR